MADYKIVNAEQLDADLTAVANAIRKRSGITAKMEFPAGFEEAVESIQTGGVELPELGDTAAQPTDIAIGKTLYDDNGNPVTGTLYESDSIDEALFANRDFTFGGTPGGTAFSVKGAYGTDSTTGIVVRKGAGLGVRNAPTDFFGDARPGDVAKGKKFTSAAGLLVDGTLYVVAEGENFMQSSNVKLSVGQMLVAQVPFNPQSGVEGAILRPGANIALRTPAENLGNAFANQVSKKATFTSANGLLVPGALPDGGGLDLIGSTLGTFQSMKPNGTTVRGIKAVASADTDRIIRAGDEIGVVTAWDKFGDAKPEDVAAGKTFTSAVGLLVTGTASGGTGGGFTVTDDGEGNVTITSSAITDNNGDVVIG